MDVDHTEAAPTAPTSPGPAAEPDTSVIAAAGTMAVGWLLLLVGLATGSLGLALLALAAMFAVAVWWRYRTRDLAAEDAERERRRNSVGGKMMRGAGAVGGMMGRKLKDTVDEASIAGSGVSLVDERTGHVYSAKERLRMRRAAEAGRPSAHLKRAAKPMSKSARRSLLHVMRGFFTVIPAGVRELQATRQSKA